MTKLINKYTLLLCWLAIALSAYAASEAQYGKLSKAWTLNADGSQEFRCSKELTLFTHTAMNGTYGESFILYNPNWQELKIHASYTKQKDGSIVKTPDNAFVEVLPSFAADAPFYNHLKEMVVVHTGLELGATIYLDYSIITKPGYYPALDVYEQIQETSPIKECQITLSVPEASALQFNLSGKTGAKASESVQGGVKKVQWTLRDIPATSREAFQPTNKENVVMLAASTYGSVQDGLKAFAQEVKSSQNYETKAFAEYLTEQATNDVQKVDLVKKHIMSHMGFSAVPAIHNGYKYRSCDDVLRSAYGTLIEKTILMNNMLNAAGISAEIVIEMPALANIEACGQSAYKTVYIKAQVDGKPIYLSAVQGGTLPITWRGSLDKTFTLDGRELTVEASPVVVKETKSIEVKADKAIGGVVVCALPAVGQGVDSWGMNPMNSQRKEMLEVPSLLQEEVTYTVTPEKGLTLATPPTQKNINNSCGKFTLSITQKGDKVEVVRRIELDKMQISPAEYKDLRTMMNEWADPNNSLLLFKK